MNKIDITFKNVLKCLITIVGYLVLPTIINVILIANFHHIGTYLIYFLIYLIMLITFFSCYYKDMISDLKKVKVDFKKKIIKSIKYWLVGLIIMLISSNIINILIKVNLNINEQTNESLLENAMFVEMFIALICAPITEEIVFRLCPKKIISNKKLYIILSGLLFAFVHLLSSINNPLSLLYLIPYGSLGIALSKIYYETDNIYYSIIIHFIHNLISIILLLI